MNAIDERCGLPSASNSQADQNCQGRHLAQQGIPDVASDDAAHGTDVHKLMSGDVNELAAMTDVEMRDVAERGLAIRRRVAKEWLGEHQLVATSSDDNRLWRRDARGNKTNSGLPDYLLVAELDGKTRVLIEDFKSLYGKIPVAPSNLQLRDLAVLAFLEFQADEVTCYINQPLVTSTPQLVVYGAADLQHAHDEMVERVAASMKPNAPRTAGEVQCKHCKAKATCKEHLEWVNKEGKNAMQLIEQNKQLSNGDQILYYKKAKAVTSLLKNACQQFEERVKANLEAWPEFEMKEVRGNRVITDPQAAVNALGDALPMEPIMQCVKVSVAQLEKAFCEARIAAAPDMKVKDAKAEFGQLLDGVITRGVEQKLALREEK